MPASQPAHFNLQEFTDVGQLMVGGRLYTYGYGTTAHKTAYTDPDGMVPHTYTPDGAGGQYIALNARGELPAPLYLGEGSYDIALKRLDGSTVWTRKADGVDNSVRSSMASLAASNGAGLMGFAHAFGGAVMRSVLDKLRDQVSALDFMSAVQRADVLSGVGAVDVTAAVQKAINTAKRVCFPNGTYRIGPLRPLPGTELVGECKQGTVLKPIGATDILAWSYATNGGPLFRFLIDTFTIDSSGLTKKFINFDGMQYGTIRNLHFLNGTDALVRLTFSYFNTLENLHFTNAAFGIWLYGSSYDNGPNHNTLRNINVENLSQWGVRMDYCRGNVIDTMDAEYTNDNLKSAIILENCSYCHVNQFWYEALFATVADPAIRITGDNTSNCKKNRLTWSPQIIHPSVALDISKSLDTVVEDYRFVGGTTSITETGNSNLTIVAPQFEGPSVAEVSFGSEDTKVITNGGVAVKQNINGRLTLQTDKDGYNSIRIISAGAEKFRVTTQPGTKEVVLNGQDGAVILFSATGDLIPQKAIQFYYSRAAAQVQPSSLFVDSADGKLKFKDANSVVNQLY